MTVYADLLFIVNLYIDALLLSAVRRFLRLPLTGKRLLLASVLGGVFGLSALLPALPGVVLFPLALLESLALCATAFAPKPMTQLLKAVFLLFLFGAALSGLLTAAAYFLPIHGILLANGAVYFNISALTLILLTCVSYGVLYGFDRLFRKKEPDIFFAKLTITRQGKTVTLPAKIDTGLTLTEPFSGTPAARLVRYSDYTTLLCLRQCIIGLDHLKIFFPNLAHAEQIHGAFVRHGDAFCIGRHIAGSFLPPGREVRGYNGA